MTRRAWLIIPFLLVAGVATAVLMLRVEQVRVTGIRSLPARDIVRASGLEPGERILWVRLSAAERRIERIPAVADAVAERSLPGTVVIHVRERVPLARLDGARRLVVDAEGLVFDAHGEAVAPVLYGWKGKARAGASVDVRSRKVLGSIPLFPRKLRESGRKLIVGKAFVLTLEGGTQIRFGSLNDLVAKAQVAEAVLEVARGHRLEYVDVRSPSVPVSKERVPPTPTAQPSAPGQPAVTASAAPAQAPQPTPQPSTPQPAAPAATPRRAPPARGR